MPRHPFLDHPGPIPFAHRGGAGEWPENTMPAFQHAIDLGYTHLETDVHATSDGVLMAFHDATLDRVTDASGRIEDLSYDEVKRARVGGAEPIPLFEELLTSFPDARINIDPKLDSAVAPLLAAVRRHDCLDRVCIGAFSDRRLAHIRAELGAGACLGMGPRQVARLRMAGFGVPTGRLDGQVAQVPTRAGPVRVTDARFVARARELGVEVHVWTIDDAVEMHRLLDLGVGGIMTDRPAVLRDVLVERGEWHA